MSTEEESIEQLPQDELYFEKEPEGLKVGVQAQNLVKVFGETVAVTGVNIKVYKNQITVLLGHNGAGKTTTLDMMAGVLPPSKGRLLINGYDMRNQSSQAHRCIGLCPQNDILYDQLTCTEHLVFYLWLRGLDTKDTCDDLLIKMGLESVVDNMAFELSRGEKRMLSLAIALSGSQVVILDEPSSGLDPSAQRGMWEVLQSIREDRTLLMTTHYMDEAEVLGDRIAIMADGVVKCCGSLQFLKHLYGTGYQLNIVTMPDCKPDKVTAFLQKILPGTQYLDKSHTELYFSLLEEDLNLFSKLFAQLEQNLQELGISSFDIKATTVEEVFMKVGDGIEPKANRLRMTANSAEHKDDHRESNVSADAVKVPDPGEMCSNQRYADESGTKKANKLLDYNEGYMPNKGRKRKLQQLKAMFIRRILLTKRQWKLTFYCVVFYPIVGLFIGILADTEIYQNIKRTIQPVELKPFGKKSSVYVWGHPGVNDQLVETYMDIFSGTSDKAERITETMNVTEYYLDKAENITLKDYPFTFLTAAEFLLVNDSNVRANALYGSTKHGDIVSVKLLLEALIKYYVANETSEFSCEMTFQTQAAKFYTVTLLFSTFTMVQISLIFFIQLGEEKQTGAKHLQQICGIDPFTFWLPSFCSHLSIYVFPVTMILMGMWYGAPESFIYGGRVRVLLLALILHGFAIMPFTYFATYFAEMLFKSLAVCAVAMFWFSSMGVILPLVEFHMRYNEKTKDDDHDEGITLLDVVGVVGVMLSLLSPTYNLLVVLLTMQSADAFHGDEADMVLGESDAQKAMTKMAAQCFCYFLLVFAVDFKLFRRIRYSLPSADVEHLKATSKIQSTEPVDDDVIAEERRIQNTPVQELCKENPLIMKGVSKVYGGKLLAVDDLYLSVAHNECFGLLGHNGAGKTAAFKMLTGNMTISQGDIYFLCQDIKTSLNSIVKHIGYCPQRNALDKSLTGRETLYLYGRLRGVPEENLDHVTRQLMKHLDITPHADKLTCNYSGGTKRKLCVGISLIGNPHLILLDEPTSGVDPAARRLIWDIFRDIRSAGKTIVMTSHSMEECEAVCTRLAIMVTGRFRCIGSLQHLKKKFGEGLSISVKMPSFLETEQERDSFLDFVKQSFPNSVITVNTTHYVRFLVLGKDIKWSTVFQTMETAKEEFSLSTYSVQQMTLEQIFLRFVKSANPPVRGKLSCKQQCLNCCE